MHKAVATGAALFGSNMHKSVFRPGLCPRPSWGAYSTPPDPLAVLGEGMGPWKRGKGREGEGKDEREGDEKEGEGAEDECCLKLLRGPDHKYE